MSYRVAIYIMEIKEKLKTHQKWLTCLESLKKQMKWDYNAMVATMKAVNEGCSLKRAAKEHKIPKMILQDRVLGRVKHRLGSEPYSNYEEENLVLFVVVSSSDRIWKQENG